MSALKKNDGGPAFPRGFDFEKFSNCIDVEGMTLRDWFAGQAIMGHSRKSDWYDFETGAIAKNAYLLADAMIAERDKNG